jgi:hypothetical protein
VKSRAGRRHLDRAHAGERAPDPHTVIPDETVDKTRNITLGGITLELHYLGLNHSDSTLVMRLHSIRHHP